MLTVLKYRASRRLYGVKTDIDSLHSQDRKEPGAACSGQTGVPSLKNGSFWDLLSSFDRLERSCHQWHPDFEEKDPEEMLISSHSNFVYVCMCVFFLTFILTLFLKLEQDLHRTGRLETYGFSPDTSLHPQNQHENISACPEKHDHFDFRKVGSLLDELCPKK